MYIFELLKGMSMMSGHHRKGTILYLEYPSVCPFVRTKVGGGGATLACG
jgi:hypothetical protein